MLQVLVTLRLDCETTIDQKFRLFRIRLLTTKGFLGNKSARLLLAFQHFVGPYNVIEIGRKRVIYFEFSGWYSGAAYIMPQDRKRKVLSKLS